MMNHPWKLVPLALLTLTACQRPVEAPLGDSDIAAVLAAASAGVLQEGQVAQSRASDASIQGFANRMVAEHTTTNQRQVQLFQQLSLHPTDNPTSRHLADNANSIVYALQNSLWFDLDYLDSQITVHSNLLTLIDGTLLVEVHSPQLQAELTTTRGETQDHLDAVLQLKTTHFPDAGTGQGPGSGPQ